MEKIVKLTNEKVKSLFAILTKISQLQSIPFKFAVIQNLSSLKKLNKSITDEESALFKKHVKLDENGDGVIKESIRNEYEKAGMTMPPNTPYAFFEYETSFKEFNELLDKFNEREVDQEIKIAQEKMSRNIKIKDKKGEMSNVTIKELISDPDHVLNADYIGFLIENEILVE